MLAIVDRLASDGAGTPRDSLIVQTALSLFRAMHIDEVLREGSTDSNVPMNRVVPAITISAARGSAPRTRSTKRSTRKIPSWRGTQRALPLTIERAR
jgi:hypothetical protein